MSALARFNTGLAALLTLQSTAQAQAPRHPLDPLGWEEHWVVLEVLRDAGHLTDATRFARLSLSPPDKGLVWSWRTGQPIPRLAHAIIKEQAKTFEADIDVSQRKLVAWRERAGVQTAWTGEDLGLAGDLVKADTAWQRAMRGRGYNDWSFVACFGIPPGNLGEPEFRGRRIAKVLCQDESRYRNRWGRGIEGLYAFVDVNEKKVVRVMDGESAPMPPPQEYDANAIPPRSAPPPMLVSQPMGAGFRLEGGEVTWQNWSFHARVDSRVGVVISTVRWNEGDRSRLVLYEGHLSEIFVPYMDPGLPWYSNNFLDAGEFYSLVGGLAQALEPGVDCPDHAVYLNQLTTGVNGRPGTAERTACIFERIPGDPAWRHRDGTIEGRPKRDLVVRFAAVLGNYDYVFDWVFQQDGTIRVAVGSTGIAETKAVKAAKAVVAAQGGGLGGGSSAGDPIIYIDGIRVENGVLKAAAERPDAYGRFVAPNIVAVNHDHYFNFRLDLDVGGAANTLEIDRLKQVLLPKDHPRRSLWVLDPATVKTEAEGKLHMDMARPALWRVVNPAQSNRQGYPVSMEVRPGMNNQTLLSADDWPRRRAGFIDHHLWVTPYDAAERYAAGDYPTLSLPGEGLPKWTAANRRVENTDIVVWYTMGFHHVMRGEDWPVMPVSWHSFDIRPFDFFDRNPAIDLSRKP